MLSPLALATALGSKMDELNKRLMSIGLLGADAPVPPRRPSGLLSSAESGEKSGEKSGETGLLPEVSSEVNPLDQAAFNLAYGGDIAAVKAISAIESGRGKSLVENMNYSLGRIKEVFPNLKNPEKYANNPLGLANAVYGGKLGNNKDEGFKYRGRGHIQITGKENYKKVTKILNDAGYEVDLVKNPNWISQSPENAAIASVAFMKLKGSPGDFKSALKAVGGHKGDWYKKRLVYEKILTEEND
jgi:putative chitinase